MTENKIDPDIYVEHHGIRVYLCCTFCRAAFLRQPEKYQKNLPQFSNTHEVGHSDHGVAVSGIGRTIRLLGKFHPMMVHFPIALIIVAALAEILFLISRKPFLIDTARYCVIVGALGAIVSVLSGGAAAEFANYSGELARMLSIHRWLGTSTAGLIVIAAILSILSPRNQRFRWTYRTFLFLAMIMIAVTGYYGGTLIYGLGHFSW